LIKVVGGGDRWAVGDDRSAERELLGDGDGLMCAGGGLARARLASARANVEGRGVVKRLGLCWDVRVLASPQL
jgi:hypothetical protein